MNNRWSFLARLMAGIGGLGAVMVTLLRVWVFPAQRDVDTGFFSSPLIMIGLMLVMLAALGALAFLLRGRARCEVKGGAALGLSTVLLLVGAVVSVCNVVDALAHLGLIEFSGVSQTARVEETVALQLVLPWLQIVCGILGGIALVRLGLRLASEGGTRRGMMRLSLLAPVLWMWFVLANYVMSYASLIRITDGFFTLATYILEMMFLFHFAGYIAGVGRSNVSGLLFLSSGTALFALSVPLVRLAMYLLQDSGAYAASGAAGIADLAVGVLALVVSISLAQGLSAPPEEKSVESDPAEEGAVWDGPTDSDAAELLEESDSDEEDVAWDGPTDSDAVELLEDLDPEETDEE